MPCAEEDTNDETISPISPQTKAVSQQHTDSSSGADFSTRASVGGLLIANATPIMSAVCTVATRASTIVLAAK